MTRVLSYKKDLLPSDVPITSEPTHAWLINRLANSTDELDEDAADLERVRSFKRVKKINDFERSRAYDVRVKEHQMRRDRLSC